jgi:hypothetical protein
MSTPADFAFELMSNSGDHVAGFIGVKRGMP